MHNSSRNLSQEIPNLKENLTLLIDYLNFAEHTPSKASDNPKNRELAEDQLENVYFQLFRLAEQSDKLKALIREGERRAEQKLKEMGIICRT